MLTQQVRTWAESARTHDHLHAACPVNPPRRLLLDWISSNGRLLPTIGAGIFRLPTFCGGCVDLKRGSEQGLNPRGNAAVSHR
jgi:hypothetical protein